MQLGLPSQLRDAVLAHVEGISETTSDANREYIVQQQLIALDNDASDGGMLGEAANEKLIKIARTVATNRKQDRVKIPLPPPPPAQEKLTTKRNAGYVFHFFILSFFLFTAYFIMAVCCIQGSIVR